MKPYYDDGTCTIYHGDCREISEWRTADVVVSDPPYGINYRQTIKSGRDYGPIAGDSTTELAEWLLNAVHPAPLIVFGPNNFAHALPVPGRWLCWDKRTVESADRMIGAPFELAWFNGDQKAGRMYRVMHGGVVNADGHGVKRVHPTQKPVVLLRRIIADIAPPGVVADPFMGSGSTLLAARDLGRRAVGVEIEERYCEMAVTRLAQNVLELGA